MSKKTELPEDFFEIKFPSIVPTNRRALCVAVFTEMKKKPGTDIFIPTLTTSPKKDGTYKEIPRFFVAKVSSDFELSGPEKGTTYIPQMGDELIPFWPEDIEGFHFPRVRDAGSGEIYYMIEQMEVAAYMTGIPKEVSKGK